MTKPEFAQWLGHHFARFTGAAGWLAKFPTSPRFEGDPTQRTVRDSWEQTLRDVDLPDAKAATDSLANGDAEFSERGYDCHPRDVRKLSRAAKSERTRDTTPPQLQRRHYDRTNEVGRMTLGDAWRTLRSGGEPEDLGGAEESFRCIVCQDSGLVTIYLPLAIQRRLDGDDAYPLYTAAVACHCDLGADQVRHTKIRFDQRQHCLVNAVRPADRLAEVQAFVGAMAGSRAEQWTPDPDDYARQFGQEEF